MNKGETYFASLTFHKLNSVTKCAYSFKTALSYIEEQITKLGYLVFHDVRCNLHASSSVNVMPTFFIKGGKAGYEVPHICFGFFAKKRLAENFTLSLRYNRPRRFFKEQRVH